jgi:hypothetical protein
MRMIICFFLIVLLNACSQLPNPITELKKEDIKKYGISYEAEKILQLGIEGISVDNDGTIHFYVQKITPKTKKEIEKELIKIFVQKIDFVLHESNELFIVPFYP